MSIRDEYTPGDVVSVRFAGVMRHYGLITPGGRVISNCGRAGGVVEQSFADFARGRPVRHHGRFSDLDGHATYARARRALGADYTLAGSNCIDFVRWSHRRRPTSWQVGRAALMAAGDMLTRRKRP